MGIANKLVWKVYSTALSVGAGILTAFVVKKAWTIATGEEPPQANDPDVPTSKALTWAIASSVGFVVSKVVTDRFAERQWEKETGELPNRTKKGHKKARVKLAL